MYDKFHSVTEIVKCDIDTPIWMTVMASNQEYVILSASCTTIPLCKTIVYFSNV